MKVIHNVNIISESGLLGNRAVVFGDKIVQIIEEKEIKNIKDAELIDGQDMYLSPGFIDIHIHGCFGDDVMDGGEDTINNISKNIVKTGVTSFLPTTMTMNMDKIKKSLELIKKNKGKTDGAEILGAHLEGPFISSKFKGAQDEKYILNPSFDEIKEYKDIIKIVTMAPENSGSKDFIEKCRENDIVVSIGHSNATYEEARDAIESGASHITHTYNAMSPLHHRNPGVVGAGMLSCATCELIVDNIHVHPAAQEILLRMKGKEKLVLVTDAMRACLMPEGRYDLGGQEVIVKEGQARLENGALAGSVLTINTALKNFIENTGTPLADAVRMVTLNPAGVIGVQDRKGSIATGKDADLVIFDKDFNIKMAFVSGNLVYGGE